MPGLRTVFSDETLQVSLAENENVPEGKVLLSFTDVGHKVAGTHVQQSAFFKAGAQFRHVLFIIDKKRSWGNAIDFDRLRLVLAPYLAGSVAYAIGNSMGATLAFLSPYFLGVKRVVAFAPQFSMHPEVVPWETRWQDYARAIDNWPVASCDGYTVPGCDYYLFFGDRGLDIGHMALFALNRQLDLRIIPGVYHDLAGELKSHGALHELIARCFDGALSDDWFQSAVIEPFKETAEAARRPRAEALAAPPARND